MKYIIVPEPNLLDIRQIPTKQLTLIDLDVEYVDNDHNIKMKSIHRNQYTLQMDLYLCY